MRMIKREVEIILTTEEIAKAFIGMGSDDQAKFFNICAEEIKTWDAGLEFQMQYVTDDKILTKEGRDVMRVIGEYATPY